MSKHKKPVGLIVALAIVSVLAIGGSVGCFFIGRAVTWQQAYDEGFGKGREWGYELGKMDEDAYNEAYNKGKSDMYNFMHNWYNGHGVLP